jgi:hypothetical protein
MNEHLFMSKNKMPSSDKKILLHSKNVKYVMENAYLNNKTPDDGQLVCPKNVELFTKIKLRNSASC